MSGVDPNGGGPLLVPGGAAAPPEGTGLTSVTAGEWDTPSTLAARLAADAAALRAAMGVSSSVEVDPLTSDAAWALVNGNGTAAIGGGLITCTTPSGAASGAPNRPSAYRSLSVSGARGADVAVRLASWTGTLGTMRAQLVVGSKADGGNATYSGTDYGVLAYASSATGDLTIGDLLPAFTSRAVLTGILTLDGQDWLRVVTSAGGYSVWTGRGGTFAAAVWKLRYVSATSGSVIYDEVQYVTLNAYRSDVQPQAFTATFADLRIVGW